MATVTTFSSGTTAHEGMLGHKSIAQNILDFSATNASAADVIEALKIPAGAIVTDVFVRIITAEGDTATATVGDATTANGWDASVNLNATAGTVTKSLEATDTYGAGKYYSAADTIDLTLGHDMDAAKIEVIAEYFMKQLA